MFEIRIHGRGGQGVVSGAELIAQAAFIDGKASQAFPSFGVERTGAPIESFARISDEFILTREQIYTPDFIIIQDPSLFLSINPFLGAKKTTKVIINTKKKASDYNIPSFLQVYFLDASEIAVKYLGKPLINTSMLGAFAAVSKLIEKESLKKAILERWEGEVGEKNVSAMEEAYEKISN